MFSVTALVLNQWEDFKHNKSNNKMKQGKKHPKREAFLF